MGIKNSTAFWPPNFPPAEQTKILGDGPAEKYEHSGAHTWIKYNDRTIAFMPSHYGTDPNTKAVLYAHNVVGYPNNNKSFAPIEVNVGESFTLYDVKFELFEAENTPKEIITKYIVSKADKSEPVDLQLNTTAHFDFKTVLRCHHDGSYFYLTLGSIGERHVDFFIWNGVLDVIESISFRSNKWCKVGDFVFNLKGSTKDTAELLIKKQTTRDISLGKVTLSFDEIIRMKDNDKLVSMQIVKVAPLHPGYFDLWCTLDVAGKDQITGYLKDMTEKKKQQFAITYSVKCKSITHPEDDAPKFDLEIKVVKSPTVNFGEEFTLMKDQSVSLNGTDVKIRFDGSSHKRGTNGKVYGFIHLKVTKQGKETDLRSEVSQEGITTFSISSYQCQLIKTQYDASVTLIVNGGETKKRRAVNKIT